MKTLDAWLSEYSADHVNKKNQRIHTICVPLIFFSVIGAFNLIHYGFVALFLAFAWYATLGARAAGLMLLQMMVAYFISFWMVKGLGTAVTAYVLAAIFVAAWFGQFYGHKLEGRSPSFFKDLQYLLIGPLWVWLGHSSSLD